MPAPPPAAAVLSSRPGRRDVLAIVAAALLAMLVVVGVHRESPRTLVSAHGLLHAALAARIAERPLALPPANPFYAGEPLPYYWTYHALAAVLVRGAGLDPLHAIETVSLLAIAVVALGAGLLCGRLFRRPGLAALALFLLFAGANVQAPVLLALRVWRDGGLPPDDGSYLWGLLHPAAARMRIGDPFAMYGPLVSVFLNTTARPVALAALVLVLGLAARAFERASAARLLALAAAAGVLGAVGSVVALSATGALGAGLGLVLFVRERTALGRALLVGLALVAGVALAAPTYLHLFGVAGGGGRALASGPADLLQRAVALGASAWLVAGLALAGALRARDRSFALALLAMAAALTAGALVLRLPNGNEDNFFHAALAVLSLLGAGAALPRRARDDESEAGSASARRAARATDTRRVARRAALIALVFVPSFACVLAPFLGRPPVPIGFEGRHLVRLPPESDRARLYAFLRDEAERDAVVVIDPGPPIHALAGNTAEIPAFTGLTLYTEREKHYLAQPFADVAQRVRAARALVDGESAEPEAEDRLAALGRPIYVLPDEPIDAAREARLVARFGEPVRREGALALWRWRAPGEEANP